MLHFEASQSKDDAAASHRWRESHWLAARQREVLAGARQKVA